MHRYTLVFPSLTRQLRIAKNENEDIQLISAKCNCPSAAPLEGKVSNVSLNCRDGKDDLCYHSMGWDDDQDFRQNNHLNCALIFSVAQSLEWIFVEYRSPEEANAAFEFLRERQVFSDIQRTNELKQVL